MMRMSPGTCFQNHKAEFLGKLAIPLLKIKNHEKKWFALKAQTTISFASLYKWGFGTKNQKKTIFLQSQKTFRRAGFLR
jgi:hypothetical protein